MAMGNGGDQLARGAHSAQFETPQVSQEKWNESFNEDGSAKLNVMNETERERQLAEEQEALKNAPEAPAKTEPGKAPFRAVQDRIIVARIDAEEKVGNLYMPDDSKEKPQEGIVVAVGPGKYVNGELQPVSIQVGERVLFGKYSGQEVKVAFQTFLILREEDIFLVKQ